MALNAHPVTSRPFLGPDSPAPASPQQVECCSPAAALAAQEHATLRQTGTSATTGVRTEDAVLLRLTSDGHALSSKRGSLWDKAAVLARSLSPKDPLGVQRNDSDPLSLTMPGAQAGGGSAAKSFQPSPTGGQQAPAAPTTQGTASSGSQQQGEWSVPAEPPPVPHGHRWTQAHRPRFRGRG